MLRRFTIVAVALLVPLAAHAENGEIVADVVYGHKDGMALTFDVFKPSGEANGAGVLFMVSGGWFSRWAPPEQMQKRFTGLLDKGFTVFAVRHGSAPRYKVPEAYEDVTRAVRYIRAHAGDFGVDASRLGVFGGSAGGHLSLMLGTNSDEGDNEAGEAVLKESSRVAAVVAYFPPVDLRGLTGPNDRFPALDFDDELADDVSPILHVSEDDPPTLLVHGTDDDLVPLSHSERIHAKFGETKVRSELVVIDGAGHGFRGEHAAQAGEALEAWFEEHLLK